MKGIHKLHLRVQILAEPDGEGFYAYSPPFPGVHAYGLTRTEAIGHAMDGIICTALTMVKHSKPLPCDHILVERPPELPTRSYTRNVSLPLRAMA